MIENLALNIRCPVGLVGCAFFVGLAFAQSDGRIGELAKSASEDSEIRNRASGGSRVDEFRRLLEMSASERTRALALKPEEKRKILQAKITEYLSLTPEEREARLRLVELWSYLEPLMRLAPAQRTGELAAVPESDRTLIEERLKQWDLLPADFQRKALENELAIQYFVRLDDKAPAPSHPSPNSPQPNHTDSLDEEKLRRWLSVPEGKRQRMYQHFQEFVEMPAKEKKKTLEVLPEDERQKLEKSLRNFEQLPPHQREAFIESFRKFENMSKEERDQFLKNAERWREMTPGDRQTWINLMNLLPGPSGPPLPPGSLGTRTLPGEGATSKRKPSLPGSAAKTGK